MGFVIDSRQSDAVTAPHRSARKRARRRDRVLGGQPPVFICLFRTGEDV